MQGLEGSGLTGSGDHGVYRWSGFRVLWFVSLTGRRSHRVQGFGTIGFRAKEGSRFRDWILVYLGFGRFGDQRLGFIRFRVYRYRVHRVSAYSPTLLAVADLLKAPTLNPEPEPENRNQKTLNPPTYTINPKPETLNPLDPACGSELFSALPWGPLGVPPKTAMERTLACGLGFRV